MRLYLIRHAQSANNVAYSAGDYHKKHVADPEITSQGHKQARLVGQHFASETGEPRQPLSSVGESRFGLTHLYCSLMTRTILTAGYIAEACGLSLQAHPDIFERKGLYLYGHAGERMGVEGPNRAYFNGRFPQLQLPDSVGDVGWYNRPVETDEVFVQRVKRAVADITQRHRDTDDCVGLVVHGDFIDQFLNELLNVPRRPKNYASEWEANWAFHNTSISRIDFASDSPIVIYLNRIDHLPSNLVTW